MLDFSLASVKWLAVLVAVSEEGIDGGTELIFVGDTGSVQYLAGQEPKSRLLTLCYSILLRSGFAYFVFSFQNRHNHCICPATDRLP
jgi:hypothetical protein